jgi:hypothetical protein
VTPSRLRAFVVDFFRRATETWAVTRKEAKDFYSSAVLKIEAMAGICRRRRNKVFLLLFLQKKKRKKF